VQVRCLYDGEWVKAEIRARFEAGGGGGGGGGGSGGSSAAAAAGDAAAGMSGGNASDAQRREELQRKGKAAHRESTLELYANSRRVGKSD
jgi:hypothetical protein